MFPKKESKMAEQSNNATFSTVLLLVLKELRLEAGVHQGHVAAQAGKTPSAWTKIENGQSPLTADSIFGACAALSVLPSYVMSLVERVIPIFNQHDWYFQTQTLDDGEDDLLRLMSAYFNSDGYEAMKTRPHERVSIRAVADPFSPASVPTVIRYCTEPAYRAWFDNHAAAYDQQRLS